MQNQLQEEEYNKQNKNIKVYNPIYEEHVEVDKYVAPLLQHMWKFDIETGDVTFKNISSVDYIQINLTSADDFVSILNITLNGRRVLDNLRNEAKSWKFSFDYYNEYEELDDGEIVETNQHVKLKMEYYWRFPKSNYDEILKRFIKYKRPNCTEIAEPFIYYCRDNKIDEVKKFLIDNKNFDINSFGYSLSMNGLMIAANNNHHDILKYLLQKGADPNVSNVDGENALMILCDNYAIHDLNTIKLLVENGVNINAKNNYDETIFDMMLYCDQQILEYLKKESKKQIRGK